MMINIAKKREKKSKKNTNSSQKQPRIASLALREQMNRRRPTTAKASTKAKEVHKKLKIIAALYHPKNAQNAIIC